MSKVLVFAYGSNMCTRRLRCRAPSATPRGIGVLRDHVLRFHKKSTDGSAKANAFPTPGGTVWGVLFEIDESHLCALDRHERGYEREELGVRTSGGAVRAHVYRASPERIDETLAPYTWYKRLVLAGAKEHELPEEYVASFIANVDAVPDSDHKRERDNDCSAP
jgi:hypothetical protein